ncbi:MAG: YdbH domain-containing protein, partial [Victivallales bacterium]
MTEEKKKSLLRRLLLPSGIVLAILILLRICIPIYIENSLCGKLKGILKVESVSCKVRSLGFAHIDLSDLRVGEAKSPFLTVDSVRVDYPLLGFFDRRVSVSGLAFSAEYRDGGFTIPGLNLENFKSEKGRAGKTSSQSIPDMITALTVRSSSVKIKRDGRQHIIPFEMRANLLPEELRTERRPKYDLTVNLHPFGESFSISGGFDSKLGKASCDLKGANISLSRFQGLTDNVKDLKFSAVADIESAFDHPAGSMELKIKLSDLDVRYNAVEIVNSTDSSGRPVPFVLQFGKKKDVVRFSFNMFRIVSPFPVDVCMDAAAGEMRISRDGGLSVGAEIKAKTDKDRFNGMFKTSEMKLSESESVALRFDAEVDSNGAWKFKFAALPDSDETVEMDGVSRSLKCRPVMFSVSGNGEKDGADINYVFKIFESEWREKGGASISMPAAEISGDIKFKAPLLKCSMKLHVEKLRAGTLNIENIDLSVPLQIPYPVEGSAAGGMGKGFLKTGMMSIGDGSRLGNFEAQLVQEDLAWRLRGVFKTVFENLGIDVSGKAGLEEGRGVFYDFDFKIPETSEKIAVDFGKFNQVFSGISLDGKLKLKGVCGNGTGVMKTEAEIGLTGANLKMPDDKASIEGLEFSVTLQDLILMKSLPKQCMKFRRFSAGSLAAENGEIEFQIESPEKYFIEKSGFSWCGGHVYSHAMRIVPGEDLEFILYCDRLNFAGMLKQIQAAEGSGDGTVNGRIPVKIRNNRLRITDGFLYSSPGQGGNIKLGYSQLLDSTSEIQKQAIDMAIAVTALKDFDYDWAKLSLNSENRKL